MMVSDDKNKSAPPTTASGNTSGGGGLNDPWTDWRPQWSPAAPKASKRKRARTHTTPPQTIHDQQEQHSPTEAVTLRVSAARLDARCQRRIVDARLWDAMTPAEQDAALHIADAFETMGRGLGYRTSNWEKIPGGGFGNAAEAQSRLVNNYIDWTKACHREKISHAMVIDMLVFGFSARQLDRDRRVRAGTARRNLMQGLTLYCLLQGWPVR